MTTSTPVPPFDSEPWGIVFMPGAGGNYWWNQWAVLTDRGEGNQLALFEFSSHAEAFVERCGPEGSSTEWGEAVLHLVETAKEIAAVGYDVPPKDEF